MERAEDRSTGHGLQREEKPVTVRCRCLYQLEMTPSAGAPEGPPWPHLDVNSETHFECLPGVQNWKRTTGGIW